MTETADALPASASKTGTARKVYELPRKRKVAIIIEATIGGTRKHLLQIVRRINLREFDVTVICSNLRDPGFSQDIDRMKKWGIRIINLPMQREIRPFQDLASLFWLARHFSLKHYDVVHTHSSKAGMLGRLAASQCGLQNVIHTPHTFAFQAPRCSRFKAGLYRFLERFAGQYTDRMVALSGEQLKLIEEEGIIHPDRIVVIPNGVPLRSEEEIRASALHKSDFGLSEDTNVIGCVGRLEPQKGHEYLIQAAEKICREREDTVFLILGDGARRRELELAVEAADLQHSVRFLGHRNDIENFYPLFDCVVMTSHYEGLPYVVLEAMAGFCPVIGFNIPSITPLVRHGATGLLARTGDIEDLADQILRMLDSKSEAQQMARNARKLVEAEYSSEGFTEKIEALYRGP